MDLPITRTSLHTVVHNSLLLAETEDPLPLHALDDALETAEEDWDANNLDPAVAHQPCLTVRDGRLYLEWLTSTSEKNEPATAKEPVAVVAPRRAGKATAQQFLMHHFPGQPGTMPSLNNTTLTVNMENPSPEAVDLITGGYTGTMPGAVRGSSFGPGAQPPADDPGMSLARQFAVKFGIDSIIDRRAKATPDDVNRHGKTAEPDPQEQRWAAEDAFLEAQRLRTLAKAVPSYDEWEALRKEAFRLESSVTVDSCAYVGGRLYAVAGDSVGKRGLTREEALRIIDSHNLLRNEPRPLDQIRTETLLAVITDYCKLSGEEGRA